MLVSVEDARDQVDGLSASREAERKNAMLSIYTVSQEVAQDALRVAREIKAHDKNLADQLTRAATSVPLNISEGSYSRGRQSERALSHRDGQRGRDARDPSSPRELAGSRATRRATRS